MEQLKLNNIVITPKKLGQGAFSSVYQGYFENEPSKLVAVKVITKNEKTPTPSQIQVLNWANRESALLSTIQHENIIQQYSTVQTDEKIYIFLQYCNGGDLDQLLQSKLEQHLSQQEATNYFRQICKGFQYLYSQKIIHRDIKPANVMLHQGRAIISDFGFARSLKEKDLPMEQKSCMSLNGSPLYVSPQILDNKEYSSKCDIWSLGIVFFEMLYGCTPWPASTIEELVKSVKNYQLYFPEKPEVDQDIKDLITQMLKIEEEERISWPDIFNHSILQVKDNSCELNTESTNSDCSIEGELLINQQKSIVNQSQNLDCNKIVKEIENINEHSSNTTTTITSQDSSMKSIHFEENNYKQLSLEQLEQKSVFIQIDRKIMFLRNLNNFFSLTTQLIIA